jgi:ParB-like chromosome segregation protein Spo0J
MNIQESPPITVSHCEVTLPKSKEELLAEETEKALGHQKQSDAQTMRAVELLKEELQHKIDEECHHKVD